RYLSELRNKVDVDVIRKSGLRIAIDSLYGTARDYLDYFLLEAGVEVRIIHNYRDPYFGGFSPECNEKNLGELRRIVTGEKFDIGLATDGDADRFGIIDERNRFVSPNTILALLSVYLKRERKIPGGLARSVATTHLIDAITGKRLHDLTQEVHAEFGAYFSKRSDMKLTPQLKESVAKRLANPPKELDGLKVRDVNTTDGVKMIFDDQTWLLFRLSGTEPVARIYAEACSPKDLKNLLDSGKKFVAPG